MKEKERIMLECRYLLSLNKSYQDLANILKISVNEVYDDLNIKLPKLDTILYERVNKVLNKNNCS